MWDCAVERLTGGRALRFTLRRDGSSVSFREVLRLWAEDEPFRSYFLGLLADAPFAGFRWETPPVTAATAGGQAFEFVLLGAPELARTPEPEAFADQLERSGVATATVLAFPNLGNDAVLVVPRAMGDPTSYVHLAAFVRGAPVSQRHHLWRTVGTTMESRLAKDPVWLSTAGMGVSWLHVRLDSRPKYYGFAPYRQWPPGREAGAAVAARVS